MGQGGRRKTRIHLAAQDKSAIALLSTMLASKPLKTSIRI